MAMLNLFVVCIVVMMAMLTAKPVEISQRVLQMDEKDKIIGYTTHKFIRDDEKVFAAPPLPVAPMNTDILLMSALKSAFPSGSPNISVTEPWQKKAETCGWKSDSYLIHHFEDTIFEQTNDVCSLAPGLYTWIVTEDYQMSFGRFANTYELTSKHANLALMRTGYVAGEIAVVPATAHNKAMIAWNLMSGTYSIPISENADPNNPMAYLENVLYPKMSTAFAGVACANMIKYGGENEFFPDVLPSNSFVQSMCTNNYFVQYENALVWMADSSSVCLANNPSATCSI